MSKFRILGVVCAGLLLSLSPRLHGSTGWCGPAPVPGSGGRRTRGRGVRSGNCANNWRRHWRGPIRWSRRHRRGPRPKLLRRTRVRLRSDFNQAPPAVLGDAPSAATAPTAATPAPSPEAVLQKNGKPVVGVTLPADWKRTTEPTMSPALGRMDRLSR